MAAYPSRPIQATVAINAMARPATGMTRWKRVSTTLDPCLLFPRRTAAQLALMISSRHPDARINVAQGREPFSDFQHRFGRARRTARDLYAVTTTPGKPDDQKRLKWPWPSDRLSCHAETAGPLGRCQGRAGAGTILRHHKLGGAAWQTLT